MFGCNGHLHPWIKIPIVKVLYEKLNDKEKILR